MYIFKYLTLFPVIIFVFDYLCIYIILKFEGENNRKKEVKIKSPLRYKDNDRISFGLVSVYMGLLILIVYILIYSVFFILNSHYIYICKRVINDLVGFESICIGFAAFIISAIIFTVSLAPKEYYLFFTRSDVIKRYRLGVFFSGVCIFATMSLIVIPMLIGTNMEDLKDKVLFAVYQTIIFSLVVFSSGALMIVYKISFSVSRFELNMLKKIHEIFHVNKRVVVLNKSDTLALQQNLKFLLEQYEKIINGKLYKVRLGNVDNISYISAEDNRQLIQYSGKILIIVTSVLGVISCFVSICSKSIGSIIGNIIAYILFILFIKLLWTRNKMGKYLQNILLSDTGFFVYLKNKKYKFIGDSSVWHNMPFNSYFDNLKNIMAFYCIICDSGIDKAIVESLMEESFMFLEQNSNNDNWTDTLINMPIIASGFYFYIKYKEVPVSIRDYISKMEFSKNEKIKVQKFLNGLIVNTCRFRGLKFENRYINNTYRDIEELNRHIQEIGYFEKIMSLN